MKIHLESPMNLLLDGVDFFHRTINTVKMDPFRRVGFFWIFDPVSGCHRTQSMHWDHKSSTLIDPQA